MALFQKIIRLFVKPKPEAEITRDIQFSDPSHVPVDTGMEEWVTPKVALKPWPLSDREDLKTRILAYLERRGVLGANNGAMNRAIIQGVFPKLNIERWLVHKATLKTFTDVRAELKSRHLIGFNHFTRIWRSKK